MANYSKPPLGAFNDTLTISMNEDTSYAEVPSRLLSPPQNTAVGAQALIRPMDERVVEEYGVPPAHGTSVNAINILEFKCDEPDSEFQAFKSAREFRKHRDRHRFSCAICTQAFGTWTDLSQHHATVHDAGRARQWYCDEPGCKRQKKPFSRKDNLVMHVRQVHKRWDPPTSPPSMSAASGMTGKRPAAMGTSDMVVNSRVHQLAGRGRLLHQPEVGGDRDDEPDDGIEKKVKFVCPFYRHDPIRYRHCLFRHTSTETSYLKQHLRRHHLPPCHCPICGEVFEDEPAKNAHIRQSFCLPRDYNFEEVTPVQREQLDRIPRYRSPVEWWYHLWDILFPDEPRPNSPYVKDPWVEAPEMPVEYHPDNFWLSEEGGITEPSTPVSDVHVAEDLVVPRSTSPPTRGRDESVGGIYLFQEEAYVLPLPREDAISSEQGGGSRQDSGYRSREGADKAVAVDDDTASIYSVDSISFESRDSYITTFSKRLAQDIDKLSCLSNIPSSCCELLSEWVKVFALKLQGESSTRLQREASVFIRKYRRDIMGELDKPRPFCKPKSIVREWVRDLGSLEDPGEETVSVGSGDEEDMDLPNLAEYELFISKSLAYQWLLSRIASHSQLETRGEKHMASIGADIRSQLLAHPALRSVSRAAPPVNVKALFSLDWNPYQFIMAQGYSLPPEEAFNYVVCLTGTFQQAQAMTIAEFFEQTWPLTHQPLQALLKKALSSPSFSKHRHSLENGLTLTFQQNESSCTVVVRGQVDLVAEIGEQLAWIATTLRSSPVSNGVLACVPKLSPSPPPYVDRRDSLITLDCQIHFEMSVDQDISCHSPGFCWASLFHNPLLVTNYPIRRRAEVDTGLEMSLSMMAELVHSWQLTSLGGRVILKGFCSLLVATAVANDAVMWHLFYNPTGERISYYDARLDGIDYRMPPGFVLRDLEARRHIVGWCSNIVDDSGLLHANLAIRETNLPTPSRSIVIEKLYVEGGEKVVAGLMVGLGKQPKAPRLTRGKSLIALLDWVADQPVVFYDVDDRRAWLVDGASALLHLVRASIERDRTRDAYREAWRFDGQLRGSSAIEILKDPDNLNAPIYREDRIQSESGTGETDVLYFFRDRVLEMLHNLETLIDSQVQAATQDGYWLQTSGAIFTKTAVGFDFWDVAKPPKDVRRRVHRLHNPGHGWVHGWVDWVRSVGAMVIFGNDFGELIRAENVDGLCPGWRTVPTGTELICCPIKTLKALQKARGTSHLGPGELTRGTLWSSRRRLFASCPCLALQPPATTTSHIDPVQFLLPKNKLGQLDATQTCAMINLSELGNVGAVVFGHIPYHKTRPRLGSSRSDEREQAHGSDRSIRGSSSEQTAVGDTKEHSPESLSLANTSPNSTQNASVMGLPGNDERIIESRPRNPLKRLWDAFLST